MSGALEDVLVLDLTTEFWSGLAAAMLGDFGARVIRVEDRAEGDVADPNRDGQHPPTEWNYLADLAHRNKRGIAVDWREPRGREILQALADPRRRRPHGPARRASGGAGLRLRRCSRRRSRAWSTRGARASARGARTGTCRPWTSWPPRAPA